MAELVIIAIAQAKPGREADMVKAQSELAAVVRRLPGCLRFVASVDYSTYLLVEWVHAIGPLPQSR